MTADLHFASPDPRSYFDRDLHELSGDPRPPFPHPDELPRVTLRRVWPPVSLPDAALADLAEAIDRWSHGCAPEPHAWVLGRDIDPLGDAARNPSCGHLPHQCECIPAPEGSEP